MHTPTVHDVAVAVLERTGPTDPMKLQKLVFFVAGEYASLTGAALFAEDIEAWTYGPVVYDLYAAYREYDERPIPRPTTGDHTVLNDLAIACVDSVVGRYGECSGLKLMRLTHEYHAWKQHYRAGEYRKVIPLVDIIAEFRARHRGLPPDTTDLVIGLPHELTERQLSVVRDLDRRLAGATLD